jgi:hypothetical protein
LIREHELHLALLGDLRVQRPILETGSHVGVHETRAPWTSITSSSGSGPSATDSSSAGAPLSPVAEEIRTPISSGMLAWSANVRRVITAR